MPIENDIDGLKIKKICFDCVGEEFLKDQISNDGKFGTCFYCGGRAKCYSIEEMSEVIETAFEQHYRRTSDQPTSLEYSLLADREGGYEWERDGYPVVDAIMDAAEIPEPAASDIQSILEDKFEDFDSAAMGEETEFSSDSYYKESGTRDDRWQEEWRAFERTLKTETRFFSRTAAQLLAEVFNGIDTMQTPDGRPLIVDAGPDTNYSAVFRARSFQLDEALELAIAWPDTHVGPPPPANAHAGRMNAHGISVFYGANNPKVALAEIRPPVGCKVAIARFDIIRPIQLLDLTALSAVTTSGSIFDPAFIARLEQTMFLRNLSRRVTLPVMPEHERFEYLATQAIADFLATENNPPLDGIIFPSVQAAGEALNFVLFHKAARVKAIELPAGAKVDAYLGYMGEEGWEHDFTVTEHVPSKEENDPELNRLISLLFPSRPDTDTRPSTLKIDLDSLRVHTVDAVQFRTTEYLVSRHRREKIKINRDF